MRWKDFPTWFKGGLIGFVISIVLIIIFSGCLYAMKGEGEGGMICLLPAIPFMYISYLTGMDFFSAGTSVTGTNESFSFYFPIILGLLVFVIACVFIGLLFDKRINWKKKIVVLIIILLIFSPWAIYTNYLKYNDKRIMLANKIGGAGPEYPKSGEWQVLNYKVCDKISRYNLYEKNDCYASAIENTGDLSICEKLIFKWTGNGF